MNITREQVEHVAKLARLSLTEEEISRLQSEMGGMIAFADQLNELDVESVSPTTHAVPMQNVFRQDVMDQRDCRDALMECAPQSDGIAIVVPRVVE